MLEHKITDDGSSTLYSSKYEQHYHSIHGAINESLHVFIRAGFEALAVGNQQVDILEIGFGTGLNALLTYFAAKSRRISYTGIEAYPLSEELLAELNYAQQISEPSAHKIFQQLHQASWNKAVQISPTFTLIKYQGLLQEFNTTGHYDLIYFDAFAPDTQPELWTKVVFTQLFGMTKPGAILTTYSVKGTVRRYLIEAGFEVEKIPGPPGKRSMLRARRA